MGPRSATVCWRHADLTVGAYVVLTPFGAGAAVLKEKRWKIGSSRPSDAVPGGAAEAMDVS